MWKQLLDLGRQLVSLIQKARQQEGDIRQLRQHQSEQDARIDRLAGALQQLAYAIQHDRDVAERDRENVLLKVENALLRFERRLSGSGSIAPDEDEDGHSVQ